MSYRLFDEVTVTCEPVNVGAKVEGVPRRVLEISGLQDWDARTTTMPLATDVPQCRGKNLYPFNHPMSP